MEAGNVIPVAVAVTAICVAVLSEILPFVKSTKANGVLQGIVNVLKGILKIARGKKN